MINLDDYLACVARLGRDLDPNGKSPLELLQEWDATDSAMRECIDFRRTVYSTADDARVAGYSATGFFMIPDQERRKVGFAFAFDVHDALFQNCLRRLCAPYAPSDPLFVGSPPLWQKLRVSEEGRTSTELLNFDGLVQQDRSEVVRIPKGFGKLPPIIRPSLVDWLRTNFPNEPLYVRLHPDRFYATMPKMTLNESVIAQGRFDDLMNFRMHPHQKEYGEYVLDECEPSEENLSQYIERRINHIRRLEVRASRKGANYLSMMIEELPREDDPNGLMIGRCVHLDTNKPNGMAIDAVTVTHLDIAINIYEGAARTERMACRLRDGRVTDASFRTHLLRVEGVPFLAVLPICCAFFQSTVLMSDWLKDLQVPPVCAPIE